LAGADAPLFTAKLLAYLPIHRVAADLTYAIDETAAFFGNMLFQERVPMRTNAPTAPPVKYQLAAAYKQVMWLARQPGVQPSAARAWYTHIVAGRLARLIRRFTGKVSASAAREPKGTLRLEHFRRIQTKLTQLVARHVRLRRSRPGEFVALVMRCERVHIVTFQENYAAMRANGNYRKAGIRLRSWKSLPARTRTILWAKMLRGRVANARQFAPK
jgi:hypothetical protein